MGRDLSLLECCCCCLVVMLLVFCCWIVVESPSQEGERVWFVVMLPTKCQIGTRSGFVKVVSCSQ